MARIKQTSEEGTEGEVTVSGETVSSLPVVSETVASVALPERAGLPTLPRPSVRRITLAEARALHPQHG